MGSKIAVPLCGIDESMIGFSINGWEVKRLNPTGENSTILNELSDSDLYKQISILLDTDGVFSALPFTNDMQHPYYLMLVKETDCISDIGSIIDVLRVIKPSCFGCWNPVTYKNGYILPVERCDSFTSNVLEMRDLLSLAESERTQVIALLQKRNSKQYPPVVNTMLSFFHNSCRPMNMYLSFVTRITILEMLIDGNAELSYRLMHHLAVLLGRTKKESAEIASNFKRAYNARSKFLHEGDPGKVTDELMAIAYEYARRVIANLLSVNDDMKTIRTTLEQAGYGDNPYQVTL